MAPGLTRDKAPSPQVKNKIDFARKRVRIEFPPGERPRERLCRILARGCLRQRFCARLWATMQAVLWFLVVAFFADVSIDCAFSFHFTEQSAPWGITEHDFPCLSCRHWQHDLSHQAGVHSYTVIARPALRLAGGADQTNGKDDEVQEDEDVSTETEGPTLSPESHAKIDGSNSRRPGRQTQDSIDVTEGDTLGLNTDQLRLLKKMVSSIYFLLQQRTIPTCNLDIIMCLPCNLSLCATRCLFSHQNSGHTHLSASFIVDKHVRPSITLAVMYAHTCMHTGTCSIAGTCRHCLVTTI